MRADIIHISGFDTYDTHDSGNYIVFNFLRQLKYDSKMILALGKSKSDSDTFLIRKEEILNKIDSAKVLVLHDSLFSCDEIKAFHEKLKCKIIIITMTHFHVATQKNIGCQSYPELNSEEENIYNRKFEEHKKNIFSDIPITLVYGSTYSGEITDRSQMYSDKFMIPLPAEVPRCKNQKNEIRRHLNIPVNKRYILWGTTQPKTPRKGKDLFDKCLDILWDQITEEQKKQIAIMSVGPHPGKFGKESNFETFYLGYQKTRKDMSVRYKAADISVCTTTADAGPMMISESMCNNTPVIAFDRSISCDLCDDGNTGYLIKNLDLNEMATRIKQILFEDNLQQMSEKSREKYLTFHDSLSIINKWNNLFAKLTGQTHET